MTEATGGKIIKLGNTDIKIVSGEDVRPICADLFSEMWIWNGQIHLGFADLVKDGSAAEAHIVGRVRMSLPMAKDLHTFLGEILATEMPGPERAN